jgi:hypothetical protein
MTMSQLDTSAGPAPMHKARSTGDAIANARWFEWLARAGLVARGAIYGIIGVLALEMAFGAGGKTTNQSGALGELAKQPGGKILLVLMAIGLFGYAFWRLLRAAVGHGPEESDDGLDASRASTAGSRTRGCSSPAWRSCSAPAAARAARTRPPAACWGGPAVSSSSRSPDWR